MNVKTENIRNFAIIAHIDHGKSTLADRIIEVCNGLEKREMKSQVLDSMDIERERGITIKSQTARLKYQYKDEDFILNIVDTPGHADFSYEVNRSLASCEGSVLVIDATQGIQAQTMANLYQAINNGHSIIPALNKVDLETADIQRVKQQLESIGISGEDAIEISAKTGLGVDKLLSAIIERIDPPQGNSSNAPQCLLIDSWYDKYMGIVILFRVFQGSINKKTKIYMMQKQCSYQVEQLGFFTPKKEFINTVHAGEIGFMTASIKNLGDCSVGDTITDFNNKCDHPMSGFRSSSPVVFCSLFPSDPSEFEEAQNSMSKIHLNDSSFVYEKEHSSALGHGFKCGFLGLLHMEIIQERLEREFNLDLIATVPSVSYKVYTKKNEVLVVSNPDQMPDQMNISKVEEPYTRTTIIAPIDCFGRISDLCMEKRGTQKSIEYKEDIIIMEYSLPLSEILFDFYDRIKSISSGYASLDWEIKEYQEVEIACVDILVNKKPVTPLAFISHADNAISRSRSICSKLKDLIPKQLYKIAIQASIGGKIIAREDISALRKNVTSKCYGGDVSRKKKLLEKQKAGKKRMRMFGDIEVPKSAFVEVLKSKDK